MAIAITLPLRMAADLPERYYEKAYAFQFIKDVPVGLQKSRYLDAEPGEYIIVTRGGGFNISLRPSTASLPAANPATAIAQSRRPEATGTPSAYK